MARTHALDGIINLVLYSRAPPSNCNASRGATVSTFAPHIIKPTRSKRNRRARSINRSIIPRTGLSRAGSQGGIINDPGYRGVHDPVVVVVVRSAGARLQRRWWICASGSAEAAAATTTVTRRTTLRIRRCMHVCEAFHVNCPSARRASPKSCYF